MEIFKKKRNVLFIITYTVILIFILFHLNDVRNFIRFILSVFSPIIYGIVFAFLVGLIVNKLEKLNAHFIKRYSVNKYLSIVLAYLLVIAVIVGMFFLIVPEIGRNINDIANIFPRFIPTVQNYLEGIIDRFQLNTGFFENLKGSITSLVRDAFSFLSVQLPNVISYTFTVVTFVKDVLFGMVISVYILLSKDHLIEQCKKAMTVIVPEKHSLKAMETMTYANKIFKGYVGGQLILSLIIGIVIYVFALIFRMPYALLNSTIIMVTNMIPIIGPIVGAIPTTLIILMVDPVKGIWFLVLVIVAQQAEANLIAPKIVGKSVGMSGLWTLVAIVLGGGFFGLIGIVVGVPVMAVIYHLVSDFINSHYNHKYDDYVNHTNDLGVKDAARQDEKRE